MSADFTIADVLAWARTKPADEEYDYCSSRACAIAQFLHDTGRVVDPGVNPVAWRDDAGEYHDFDSRIDDASQGRQGHREDRTFGQFADRLEALALPA